MSLSLLIRILLSLCVGPLLCVEHLITSHGGSDLNLPSEMSGIKQPDPFKFSGNLGERWRQWSQMLDLYIAATRPTANADQKGAILLSCIGEAGLEIYNSFDFEAGESKLDYTLVKAKFGNYCVPRKNVVFERHKFYQLEKGDQTVDAFMVLLKNQAAFCEFQEKDNMIRDKLIFSLKKESEETLKQSLWEEKDLTLEKAFEKIQLFETTRAELAEMRRQGQPVTPNISIDAASSHQQWKKSSATTPGKRCIWCGLSPHAKADCPAQGDSCFRCGKWNHWAVVCNSDPPTSQSKTKKRGTARNRRVAEAKAEPVGQDSDSVCSLEEDKGYHLLGEIVASTNADHNWQTDVKIGGRVVRMKVDTGAGVTVLNDAWKNRIQHKQMPVRTNLTGPDGSPLEITRCGEAEFSIGKQKVVGAVYFVRNIHQGLLGLPEIRALGIPPCWDVLVGGLDSDAADGTSKQEFKAIPGSYEIEISPDAKPYAESTSRKIPLPHYEPIKKLLLELESKDIIRKVKEPTPWCAGVVVEEKRTGGVRLCVDLTRLNRYVQIPRFPIEAVETTLARLGPQSVFSKLDAEWGFHQVRLAEQSQLLTTFITPFGRYCYKRLPFGLSSAPEYYQQRMTEIVGDVPGVVVRIDDIIVGGSNEAEHNARLSEVLARLKSAGVTLNEKKCIYKVPRVKFLGHILDANGVHVDPAKVQAVAEMPAPNDVSGVRSFLGLVNHLGKYIPQLATLTEPLRQLMSKGSEWTWDMPQQTAFEAIKQCLASAPVLAVYEATRPTKVSADASNYGLGAALWQKHDETWRPIAYASRALTDTERRYAQIEKESLALVWGVEKFSEYLRGMESFILETDHKPLVSLFGVKALTDLPLRLQRFGLRLMPFRFEIRHVPGKTLVVADHLSRHPISTRADVQEIHTLQDEKDPQYGWPASDRFLQDIAFETREDPGLSQVAHYVRNGWPATSLDVAGLVRPYFQYRSELLIESSGLLTFKDRIVIPPARRLEMLDRLHTGHVGIRATRLRAQQSIWWPGISQQLEGTITSCRKCLEKGGVPTEPLTIKPLPDRPWVKVGTDLFYHRGSTYLLVVDYYSKFLEVQQLENGTTAKQIIGALRKIFGRHGVPEVVVSDNGPQYMCREMKQFAEQYGFKQVHSNPYNPRENGEAERFVQTAKSLLASSDDPCLSLMMLRSTPNPVTKLSPAELLYGRRIRTPLPQLRKNLAPNWKYDFKEINEKQLAQKFQAKMYHDHRTRAKPLPALKVGDRAKDRISGKRGQVESRVSNHSYSFRDDGDHTYARNRRHLVAT